MNKQKGYCDRSYSSERREDPDEKEARRPELSIIVCAFNEEERIAACIESLLTQNYDRKIFEIIIMDNESSDQTPVIAQKMVAKYSSILSIRYFRIKHVGLSTSRNTGISYARGKIIAFIDADARAESSWIAHILDPFEKDEKVFAVAGRVANLNDESLFAKFIYWAHFRAGVESRKNEALGALTGANMAFRKDVFAAGYGFYDAFASYGDETTAALRYFEAHPSKKVANSFDAIVFNEHPERFTKWLKQRYFQGRMQAIIAFNVSLRVVKVHLALKIGLKALGVLAYPSLFAQLVFGFSLIWISPFLLPLILGLYSRRHYVFQAFRHVTMKFDKRLGLLGVAVVIIGHIFSDAGFVKEGFLGLLGKRVNLNCCVSETIISS